MGRFSDLLRQLRKDAGLTQEELAERARVSGRAVSDLEREVSRLPHKDTIRALTNALGLTGAARAGFEAAARGRSSEGQPAPQSIGAVAATRTLPRDTAVFTGREPQLEQVGAGAGMTATSTGGIYTIGGMPGAGKTAFAVHAAYQLAGQFPDGQIFLPLHGHTPGRQPADPSDALASLLQITGVERMPSGLENRTALWRDRMAGKQVLLVLDDAVGHEQVRPLLPSSGRSMVLITSRRHLTALEGAQVISLGPMTPEEAAALLARLANRPVLGPDDPAIAEIARLCGFLPLAIGMLGRQLNHHPAWTAGDVAADLARTHDRLEPMQAENLSVAAAFDLSYQDLTADQRRLFRRLGLHPGTDVDAHAVAVLAGVSPAAARSGLDALYDCHLLTEPARSRYRFHDLIRHYAQAMAERDPEAERTAAIGRLLAYYTHTAQIAGSRLSHPVSARSCPLTITPPEHAPDLAAPEQARRWMAAERLNLHAIADYAAAHGLHECVIALSAAMHDFLRVSGYMDQALNLHRKAVRAAQDSKNTRAEADALDDLATAQRLTADRMSAAASLGRALELYREADDQAGEARALVHLGRVRHLTDDYAAAMASLRRALGLHQKAGDQLGQASAYHELGVTQRLMADFSAALASETRALELFHALGDTESEAAVLNNLGMLQSMLGDYLGAVTSQTQAMGLYTAIGHRNGQANALKDLGVVQLLTGDYAGAAASQERALAAYQEIGSRFGEASVRYELGLLHRTKGDLPAAADSLNQAIETFRKLRDQLSEANVLTDLGVVRRLAGDYSAAATCLTTALRTFHNLGERLGEAETLNNLGELAQAVGDAADARTRHEQALLLARDIGASLEEARALEGLGRCHLLDQERHDGLELLRDALAIYQRLGAPNAGSVQATLGP